MKSDVRFGICWESCILLKSLLIGTSEFWQLLVAIFLEPRLSNWLSFIQSGRIYCSKHVEIIKLLNQNGYSVRVTTSSKNVFERWNPWMCTSTNTILELGTIANYMGPKHPQQSDCLLWNFNWRRHRKIYAWEWGWNDNRTWSIITNWLHPRDVVLI